MSFQLSHLRFWTLETNHIIGSSKSFTIICFDAHIIWLILKMGRNMQKYHSENDIWKINYNIFHYVFIQFYMWIIKLQRLVFPHHSQVDHYLHWACFDPLLWFLIYFLLRTSSSLISFSFYLLVLVFTKTHWPSF